MKAAGRGHLPMMEELLLFDANVHEIDRVGNNALCYAAITGKMKTIHYLVFEAGISLCDHDVSQKYVSSLKTIDNIAVPHSIYLHRSHVQVMQNN